MRGACIVAVAVLVCACGPVPLVTARDAPSFEGWLASDERELSGDVARFGSGRCGDVVVSDAVARGLAELLSSPSPETPANLADFKERFGLPLSEARDVVSGFYASWLERELGFFSVETFFMRDGDGKPELAFRGTRPHPDGRRTVTIYFRAGRFLKERTSGPMGPDPVKEAADPRVLVPVSIDWRLPGEIERILVPHGSGFELWSGGKGREAFFDESLLPGRQVSRRFYVQTTTPCTFVDALGKTFAGRRRATYFTHATSLDASEAQALGLERRAQLVRVSVNRGAGGGNIDWVVTKIDRLDGSSDLPLDVAAVEREARAELDRHVADQANAIGSRFAELTKGAPGPDERAAPAMGACANVAKLQIVGGPAVDSTTQRYAWLPAERRLRIAITYRRALRWTTYRDELESSDCPPGAACEAPMHECKSVSNDVALELSGLFEYDARGAKLSARFFPPQRATP